MDATQEPKKTDRMRFSKWSFLVGGGGLLVVFSVFFFYGFLVFLSLFLFTWFLAFSMLGGTYFQALFWEVFEGVGL